MYLVRVRSRDLGRLAAVPRHVLGLLRRYLFRPVGRALRLLDTRAFGHALRVDLAYCTAYGAASYAVAVCLPTGSLLWTAGYAWLGAEIAWFFFGKRWYWMVNQPTLELPDVSRLDLLLERFLGLSNVFDLRDFLSGWFLDAPGDAIPRGNVEEVGLFLVTMV
jgi:hypothetical protein